MPAASARSTSVRAEARPPDEGQGPGVYGVIDVLRGNRIAGWVIDRRDSRASLEVDILREGRLLASVRADRPRRDLERTGVGTGLYGFACDLDPPLEPGFEFTLAATARAADGLALDLKRPAAKTSGDPARRLAERTFEEVTRLNHHMAVANRTSPDDLREVLERVEVAQARIEAALRSVEPPARRPERDLKLLFGVSLSVALVSLVTGIYSLLQG